ncbi:hypothetical protein [Nocardia nova]|jgi:hypothetical protein|uniref:hypothetical protein n=1 Tax=Nocardia nova TaxID=37330 RepID=UPI0018932466|nr:hypothetical protein [Nocardia nova]MBF6147277.1 hypothetical protein [Nocardia nova]MDN2499342.1 hypothetical protein [Nocardia nova]
MAVHRGASGRHRAAVRRRDIPCGAAANELTPTEWDPASKQPLFKSGAAAVELVRPARRSERVTTPAVELERSAR